MVSATAAAQDEMKEFFRSFMLYEYPILDPNSRFRDTFRRLLCTLTELGENIKGHFPDHLVALVLRGSYSHGHPYEGNDVDVLFIGNKLCPPIEEAFVRLSDEALSREGFEICHGKEEDFRHKEPVRFLDLQNIPSIINAYLYGLDRLLYLDTDTKEKRMVGYGPMGEKKVQLLQSGILIPFLLWVYGFENVARVFYTIGEILPIPTRPHRGYSADAIRECKETLRQTYIARTLTGRPVHLGIATGYPIPMVEPNDYGSEPHREAEELFWALRPLREIYLEAIRKHIIQAKIELDVLGRRLSPERILTFAPSYDGLVRRRLRSQWGQWVNW